MNYQETLDFMFSQLPMYQRIGKAAYKANLDNTIALLDALGNPQTHFKSIHIAGTNGKGSSSHMLASVFQEAGYKTGLYTSPHLLDFRERIKIDGEMIAKEEVVKFIDSIRDLIDKIKPSFFELTVAMAFVYFKDQKVDIAIIETGLGGRLDSTNVINPELAVITNIGLDHTQFLGDDLLSIAKEKGGIIKENTPLVIGQVNDDIRDLYTQISEEKNAAILFSDDLQFEPYKTDLLGSYQVFNIRTVLASIRVMRQRNWNISDKAIKLGLESVKKNTGLSGRWDVIQENPKVICDTGHNKEGLTEVLDQLQKENFEELHIVMGMVNDKDPATVLSLFPTKAKYYFCQASVPRSLNVNELLNNAVGIGLHGKAFNSVSEAYSAAIHDATPKDLVFVGGSTFVVADFLNHLEINRPI